MRQVGIICGPFFIFWTKTWDFNLFGTEINSYNSASLLERYILHGLTFLPFSLEIVYVETRTKLTDVRLHFSVRVQFRLIIYCI